MLLLLLIIVGYACFNDFYEQNFKKKIVLTKISRQKVDFTFLHIEFMNETVLIIIFLFYCFLIAI